MRARVVLADDHQEIQEEIRRMLAVEFDVVCSVSEGLALVKAASEFKPDIVISDVNMPLMSGPAAVRQILKEGSSKKAILLTMYNDPELVRGALEAGIQGYVLKTDAGEELIPAIKMVLSGHTYISRRVSKLYGQN